MSDDRELFTQELDSAQYLLNSQDTAEPQVEQRPRRVKPRQSGVEHAVRLLGIFVFVFMLAAAGGLYWQNRAAIASGANNFKRNSTSGVDLLLWASGSNKTFSQGLTDKLKQAQRDTAYQLDQMKPAFKTEFDHVDLQNLSNTWNGGASRTSRTQ